MPDSLAEFIQICVGLLTIGTVIWKGGEYVSLLKAATDRNYQSINRNTEATKEEGNKIYSFVDRLQRHQANEFKWQADEIVELKKRIDYLETQLSNKQDD